MSVNNDISGDGDDIIETRLEVIKQCRLFLAAESFRECEAAGDILLEWSGDPCKARGMVSSPVLFEALKCVCTGNGAASSRMQELGAGIIANLLLCEDARLQTIESLELPQFVLNLCLECDDHLVFVEMLRILGNMVSTTGLQPFFSTLRTGPNDTEIHDRNISSTLGNDSYEKITGLALVAMVAEFILENSLSSKVLMQLFQLLYYVYAHCSSTSSSHHRGLWECVWPTEARFLQFLLLEQKLPEPESASLVATGTTLSAAAAAAATTTTTTTTTSDPVSNKCTAPHIDIDTACAAGTLEPPVIRHGKLCNAFINWGVLAMLKEEVLHEISALEWMLLTIDTAAVNRASEFGNGGAVATVDPENAEVACNAVTLMKSDGNSASCSMTNGVATIGAVDSISVPLLPAHASQKAGEGEDEDEEQGIIFGNDSFYPCFMTIMCVSMLLSTEGKTSFVSQSLYLTTNEKFLLVSILESMLLELNDTAQPIVMKHIFPHTETDRRHVLNDLQELLLELLEEAVLMRNASALVSIAYVSYTLINSPIGEERDTSSSGSASSVTGYNASSSDGSTFSSTSGSGSGGGNTCSNVGDAIDPAGVLHMQQLRKLEILAEQLALSDTITWIRAVQNNEKQQQHVQLNALQCLLRYHLTVIHSILTHSSHARKRDSCVAYSSSNSNSVDHFGTKRLEGMRNNIVGVLGVLL